MWTQRGHHACNKRYCSLSAVRAKGEMLAFGVRSRVRNSCEQPSIPLRRPIAWAQRLTGAPAPAAMACSTRKHNCPPLIRI